MEPILTVYRDRTNVVQLALGYNASADAFTSQIRAARNGASELLATWTVTFVTDGADGELLLTLDDTEVAAVTRDIGWMDIKRITGGEPVTAHNGVIKVVFEDTVTQ